MAQAQGSTGSTGGTGGMGGTGGTGGTGRLAGKVAIVTGAGSSGPGVGSGKAISVLFARQGAKVLLVDNVAARAEETLAMIRKEGGEAGQASVFEADITKEKQCEALVKAAVERYGKLDILVNNVGISITGTVVEMREEDWDTVLAVNLKSMMLCSKHAIPKMAENGGGAIVNIASSEGLRSGTLVPIASYNASKGGVLGLTHGMAVHHGRQGVRVNAIAPGFMTTPMVRDHLSPEKLKERREAAPIAIEGTGWDVAWAAVFLASDEARWISGVTLPVDGGMVMTTPLSHYSYSYQPQG